METIKLDADFFGNPKIEKLRRRFGNDGIVALLQFWCWCAKYQPDGDISWMEEEDYGIAAGLYTLKIKPNWFWEVLDELRFIDNTEKGYKLHNWKKFQGLQ